MPGLGAIARPAITIGAYLVSLAVTAFMSFVAVLVLAGPHGGLLPEPFSPLVIGIGWICVLMLPAWVAYKVWRRLG